MLGGHGKHNSEKQSRHRAEMDVTLTAAEYSGNQQRQCRHACWFDLPARALRNSPSVAH